MTLRTSPSSRSLVTLVAMIAASSAWLVSAQTQPRPGGGTQAPRPGNGTQAPRPARPAPEKPPASPAPARKPPEAPPPAARDVRFRTVYTTGDRRTESVAYQKGSRERFEFSDLVLIKQHDLKRTLQVSRAANTYVLVPNGQPAPPPAPPRQTDAAPRTPGVVVVTTTVVDTGERKMAFGRQARHITTTIERQPMPNACDQAKQRIVIDGWYVDVPGSAPAAPVPSPQASAGCVDEVKTARNGSTEPLGLPIGYSMTMTGDDGKPNVVSMEVTELEVATFDASLFDVPSDVKEAGDIRAFSRAISDAQEANLAREIATPAATARKTPGTVRIGVPELINKTTLQLDTRALRSRLIADLVEAKLDAEALPAAPQSELLQRTAARGNDFLVVAEVTELKTSKGGGAFGGLLKAASTIGGADPSKEPTEAAIAIKLVDPDGKQRLSTNVRGKDGGFGMKQTLGLARFAGTMYLNMMTGRIFLNALNSSMAGSFEGMGMLYNPALFNMQAQGLGIGGFGGGGLDPIAGAASLLVQQAMASETTDGVEQGPSFDAALDEALKNAAKAVSESVKKANATKKE